jgi:hypothetical protein
MDNSLSLELDLSLWLLAEREPQIQQHPPMSDSTEPPSMLGGKRSQVVGESERERASTSTGPASSPAAEESALSKRARVEVPPSDAAQQAGMYEEEGRRVTPTAPCCSMTKYYDVLCCLLLGEPRVCVCVWVGVGVCVCV